MMVDNFSLMRIVVLSAILCAFLVLSLINKSSSFTHSCHYVKNEFNIQIDRRIYAVSKDSQRIEDDAESNSIDNQYPYPLKTGKHTYAKWLKVSIDKIENNNEDDDDDDDDTSDDTVENMEFDDTQEDAYNDSDNYNASVNADYADGGNKFIDWLRKLYTGIFFYGLDDTIASSPRPKSSSLQADKRRGGSAGGNKRPSHRPPKSPFFTIDEQFAATLPYDSPFSSVSGNNMNSNEKLNIEDIPGDKTNDNNAVVEGRILLQSLDDQLLDLKKELRSIDTVILKAVDSKDAVAMKQLRQQRSLILNDLESAQIKYVTVRAMMEND